MMTMAAMCHIRLHRNSQTVVSKSLLFLTSALRLDVTTSAAVLSFLALAHTLL